MRCLSTKKHSMSLRCSRCRAPGPDRRVPHITTVRTCRAKHGVGGRRRQGVKAKPPPAAACAGLDPLPPSPWGLGMAFCWAKGLGEGLCLGNADTVPPLRVVCRVARLRIAMYSEPPVLHTKGSGLTPANSCTNVQNARIHYKRRDLAYSALQFAIYSL